MVRLVQPELKGAPWEVRGRGEERTRGVLTRREEMGDRRGAGTSSDQSRRALVGRDGGREGRVVGE